MNIDDHPDFDTASFGESDTGAQREKLHHTPYDLVPFQEFTDAYIRVAEHGAKKYAPWNWSKGLARVQILCSLLRHTFAYLRGEERDENSGLLHTDHILWNATALSHNVHHNLEDGRRKEPKRSYAHHDGDQSSATSVTLQRADGSLIINHREPARPFDGFYTAPIELDGVTYHYVPTTDRYLEIP